MERDIPVFWRGGGRFVVSDIYSANPIPEEYRSDPVAVSECWAGSVTRDEYLDQYPESRLLINSDL